MSGPLTMFRDISTRRKLVILCSAFVLAIAVAIYSLVAEKQITIQFAQKELIGVRYIETVRGIYARLLGETLKPGASDQAPPPADAILAPLAKAEAEAGAALHTASLEQTLADTL